MSDKEEVPVTSTAESKNGAEKKELDNELSKTNGTQEENQAVKADTQEEKDLSKSKGSDNSNDTKPNLMRIRKRKLDSNDLNTAASKSSFSARQERSETPNSIPRQSSPAVAPSWTKKTRMAPAPWMNKEDVEKYEAQQSLSAENSNNQVQTYDEEQRLAEERRIRREIEQKSQFIDQTVIQHYNQRAYQSKRERRDESEIIKLRNYHNIIKFILIGTYTNPGERALDMGCGKGGDLNKWEKAQVSKYIGVDISNSSIREAIRRFKNNRYEFSVSFITGDCFGIPLPTVLDAAHIDIPRELPVDVVSMQFCMHYAFESEEKATTMIRNVAWALKLGGRFVGTIPNSDFIKYKLRNRKSGEKGFGNSLYSVTFPKEIPSDGDFSGNPYGNVYNYYLRDAIDNVPEYVVPFNSFRSLAAQYGLDLIYNKPFAELFKEHMPTWHRKLSPRMIQSISRRDGKMGLEGDEVEASAFYTSFVFVKAR